MKHKPPSTINEIIDALEASAKDVHTMAKRKSAAKTIAYGILYGNNAVEVKDFFDEYPELEMIAEAALEFDYETDKWYLWECWNRIVGRIVTIRGRLSQKENTGKPPSRTVRDYLCDFYQDAVLPQFGINDFEIKWGGRERLGPDEYCQRFWIEGCEYALISEDYQELGSSPYYIENHLGLLENEYKFVMPTSATGIAPSYNGFKRMPVPYKYIRGATDTFTLLRVYSAKEKASTEPVKIHQRYVGGEVVVSQAAPA